jgi:hypothetical protein
MSASFVLGSEASSTYPRGYASGLPSTAAALDSHFDHPAIFASLRTVAEPFECVAIPVISLGLAVVD